MGRPKSIRISYTRRGISSLASTRFGSDTWQTHARTADHGETFGHVISVRGERHCGTGWARAMANENCADVRHYWSAKLDSDGLCARSRRCCVARRFLTVVTRRSLCERRAPAQIILRRVRDRNARYGWKHDFIPKSFSRRSHDAIFVVYRNAVEWVPKMAKESYSPAIGKAETGSGKGGLARFVAHGFTERGRTFRHLLHLRAAKCASDRSIESRPTDRRSERWWS